MGNKQIPDWDVFFFSLNTIRPCTLKRSKKCLRGYNFAELKKSFLESWKPTFTKFLIDEIRGETEEIIEVYGTMMHTHSDWNSKNGEIGH